MTTTAYEVLYEQGQHPVKAWTRGVSFDENSKKQLLNIAKMPFIHKWIAAMPDVHLGKGATIGSVIPTIGAVIPAAVGVDLGCFTGDTLIPVLDGKSYSIKELADTGQEIVVYACTESGKVVAAKATAKKTRVQATLLKVTLDNGQEIRCTPDHQFMLRDGSWREAEKLTPETSLMPLYRQVDKEGYVLVKQNYSGRWQRAHWLVARSGLLGEVPRFENQRTIIHHKNFDQADNSLDNLIFMGDAEHSAYHRNLVDRNKHWQSPEFEQKRKAAITAKAATLEGHQLMAKQGTANITRYMQERPEHFKAAVADNGERGKNFLVAYNQSERGRQKSSEITQRFYPCELCGDSFRGGFGIHNHRKSAHGFNHKVVSITPLQECEDVYCLTVPEHHNFALAAGVFVHNCGMMAMKTSLTAEQLPDSLSALRSEIEKRVPHGLLFDRRQRDTGSWGQPPDAVMQAWLPLNDGFERLCEKYPRFKNTNNINHLGTLGSGNHFIEVCLDETNAVWVMLHSGSRGVGNRIGTHFIELAKKDMERWFINLPDKDLAYIPEGTEHFKDYLEAVSWAQDFAMTNRVVMMNNTLQALRDVLKIPFEAQLEAVNCHHNYISREHHYDKNVVTTHPTYPNRRELNGLRWLSL